jgi:TPR repeat protein
LEEYIKGAEAGNSNDQTELALLYLEGAKGAEKDLGLAVRWLKEAASAGNPKAQYNLSYLHSAGLGVPKDSGLALELLKESAEQGYHQAEQNMGTMYILGELLPQDTQKALYWYDRAASHGDLVALYQLGILYLEGKNGIEGDLSKAAEYFQRAAKGRLVDAQYNLALMYYHGHGVTRDKEEAFRLFSEAAKRGSPQSQYNLSTMYLTGEGGIKDEELAFYWCQEAARAGVTPAEADMGLKHLYGDGGAAVDYEKAAEWLERAAGKGNILSASYLGIMYDLGEGVFDDPERALKWYQVAADGGDLESMRGAALLYLNLEVRDVDPIGKGMSILEKAAELGHHGSMTSLADILWDGKLVPRDPLRAATLYQEAALLGNSDAKYAWAIILLNDPSDPANKENALRHLRDLAAESYPGAKKKLSEYDS